MLMEERFGVKGNSDPKKDWRAFRQKNKTESESSRFRIVPGDPTRALGREEHSLLLFVLFRIKRQTKFCLAFY